jgi:hypothetical protein
MVRDKSRCWFLFNSFVILREVCVATDFSIGPTAFQVDAILDWLDNGRIIIRGLAQFGTSVGSF